uniref:Uncharacterized protein n=1 Tax=Brassica campestris TaxID=3711 RepID=M4DZY5_BRACM
MAPRRKLAAPSYVQLFGEGSGTSSSGPSSSDAVPDSQPSHSEPSQRVAWSPPPPPQMPPPPPPAAAPQPVPEGAVHPDLCVPSYAPFARYTVEDLLAQHGREGLDVLDLDRPRGTYWFGANNRVNQSVSKTIKRYYDWAYPNWSKTPNHHPSSIKKANLWSASRITRDKDGHLPMLHRTRQKPLAGIRLEAPSNPTDYFDDM